MAEFNLKIAIADDGRITFSTDKTLGIPAVTPIPIPVVPPIVVPPPVITPPPVVAPPVAMSGGLHAYALEKPYGSSPVLMAEKTLYGSRNETISQLFSVTSLSNTIISIPSGLSFQLYRVDGIPCNKPSYTGAKTGIIPDACIPVTGINQVGLYLVEITIPAGFIPGLYPNILVAGNKLNLHISDFTLPTKASMPLYIELTTYFLLLGHYGKWANGERDLAKAYAQILSDHRIQPIKNWVTYPINSAGEFDPGIGGIGFDSYTSVTLPTQKEMIFVSTYGDDKFITQTYLGSLNKWIETNKLQGRVVTYLWDEPSSSQMAQVITRAKACRQYAPLLKTMVTTEFNQNLEGLVDIYCPVLDWVSDTKNGHPHVSSYSTRPYWVYTSCMAHGCDSDYSTGFTPDLVIDRPSYHPIAFYQAGWYFGAQSLLYYNSVEGYRNTSQNMWDNPYLFSGNGDGTLFYPGKPDNAAGAHMPIASLRLKLLREGSYMVDYWNELVARGKKLPAFSDPKKTDWVPLHQAITPCFDARELACKQLMGLI